MVVVLYPAGLTIDLLGLLLVYDTTTEFNELFIQRRKYPLSNQVHTRSRSIHQTSLMRGQSTHYLSQSGDRCRVPVVCVMIATTPHPVPPQPKAGLKSRAGGRILTIPPSSSSKECLVLLTSRFPL